MKKLLVCVMALAAGFVVTGCDKKENNNNGVETTTTAAQDVSLVCEVSNNDEKVKITVVFANDAIKKATFTNTEKFATEKEAKKEHEDNSAEFMEALKNKGMTGSISDSGTLVTRSVTFTVADLDDKAKVYYDEMFGEIKDKKYDDTKSYLETAGYTCK